ncbi:MAG: hypothetical protein V6006_00625 [Candidatus Dasytiphilus stammeri]
MDRRSVLLLPYWGTKSFLLISIWPSVKFNFWIILVQQIPDFAPIIQIIL